MEDYVAHIVEVANKLDIGHDTISNRELFLFILGGLESEYYPIVIAITTISESFGRFGISFVHELCL